MMSKKDTKQFPIDTKQALFAELRVLDANDQLLGYAGALVVVGAQLSNVTLDTSNGNLDLATAKHEYWYSPSGEHAIEVESAEGAEQLQLRIREWITIDDETNEEEWQPIIDAIECSDALAPHSGSLAAVFRGAADEVPWSSEPDHLARIEGRPTYTHTDGSDITWGLTIEQDGTTLQAVHWTHDGPEGDRAHIELGSSPAHRLDAEYEADHIFVGYS